MKYTLKSKISRGGRSQPKVRQFSQTEKASYALFVQFLQYHDIFEAYINNLLSQGRIQDLDIKEVENFAINIMRAEGAAGIIDRSLDWSRCIEPIEIGAISQFWSIKNDEFSRLFYKFEEEVLDVG